MSTSETAYLVRALEWIAGGMADNAKPWWNKLSELGWAKEGTNGVWFVTPRGRDILGWREVEL